MRFILAFIAAFLICRTCNAWSEGGHHLIGTMAFELLTENEKLKVLTILARHPRYVEDFALPTKVIGPEEIQRWLIGRAGYWPDVARSQPKYNRSEWHWQLGATKVIGDDLKIPETPGPLPLTANLNTKELHIAQAVALCELILNNNQHPPADRAIALCWLLHLVADAHQPCNAGSLYVVLVFPDGDRGANRIPTKQSQNLHLLWDGLLGTQWDAGDIRRRSMELRADTSLWSSAMQTVTEPRGMDPLNWLAESREVAKVDVYAPEIIAAVDEAMRTSLPVATIDLSGAYLKNAGLAARKRGAAAAHRLAAMLRKSVVD